MNLSKTLAELRQQREALDQAIASLERLASGRPRGRGRPPGPAIHRPKKRKPAAGADDNRDRLRAAMP